MPRRLESLRVRLVELFGGLPRRAWLTIRYRGLGQFVLRAATFPLRFLPVVRRFVPDRDIGASTHARGWYRRNWRPVTVVVPSYGPPESTIGAVRSLHRTCDPKR